MANVKVKWHGEKVERMVLHGVSKNLDKAAMFWVRFAQQRLGVPNISSPGDYPGKDGGHLRKNIAWEPVSQLVRRVGTNVEYGKFLELGTKAHKIKIKTKKMLSDGVQAFGKVVNHPGFKPRPWMRLTNNLTRTKLAKIIGRKI